MTDSIDPSNPEFALQAAATDAGLTAIDLMTVILILKGAGTPMPLMDILSGAMAQIVSMGASLEAVRTGMYAMMAARDEALAALAQTQQDVSGIIHERDEAVEGLKELEYNLDAWNMNDPRVKALIAAVWETAQADLIEQMKTRKGA